MPPGDEASRGASLDDAPAHPSMNPPSPHPVVRRLRSRARAGSRPGCRRDGARVALVIEGGGLSGVVSAGMATALEELGLVDAFDAVYGTSAGAYNGAYLLAGQAAYGTSIYYENINGREFVDRWRPLRGKPMVSIDFLVDRVVRRQKILYGHRVIGSPIPLGVVVAPTDRDAARVVRGFEDAEALYAALRATAKIPILAGGPVRWNGAAYFDGGVVEPIPFRPAIDDGHTHLLVLLSSPVDYVFPPPGPRMRWLLGQTLGRRYPATFRGIVRRSRQYRRDKAWLRRVSEEPSAAAAGAPGNGEEDEADRGGSVRVLAVWPRLDGAIDPMETDARILRRGAAAGRAAIHEVLASS